MSFVDWRVFFSTLLAIVVFAFINGFVGSAYENYLKRKARRKAKYQINKQQNGDQEIEEVSSK